MFQNPVHKILELFTKGFTVSITVITESRELWERKINGHSDD